jgi:FtsZ-interacting cell division protein YlmF
MRCATTRAITSVEPPALCGTISRIGRLGYCCAPAGVAVANKAAHSNTNDEL